MGQSAPAATARALVIEDSSVVRTSFVAAFEDEGYEAADGRSGLEQFAAHRPDIVITDLRMPDVDGMEVIKEIRKSSSVPVIVVSAISDMRTRGACLCAGATDYIVKGGNVYNLVERARRRLIESR